MGKKQIFFLVFIFYIFDCVAFNNVDKLFEICKKIKHEFEQDRIKNIATVNGILKNKINLNSRNKLNETPLIVASRNGHQELVYLLLNYLKKLCNSEQVSILKARNSDGNTALTEAFLWENVEIVNIILKYITRYSKEDQLEVINPCVSLNTFNDDWDPLEIRKIIRNHLNKILKK